MDFITYKVFHFVFFSVLHSYTMACDFNNKIYVPKCYGTTEMQEWRFLGNVSIKEKRYVQREGSDGGLKEKATCFHLDKG